MWYKFSPTDYICLNQRTASLNKFLSNFFWSSTLHNMCCLFPKDYPIYVIENVVLIGPSDWTHWTLKFSELYWIDWYLNTTLTCENYLLLLLMVVSSLLSRWFFLLWHNATLNWDNWTLLSVTLALSRNHPSLKLWSRILKATDWPTSLKTTANQHLCETSRFSSRNPSFMEQTWSDSRNHRKWSLNSRKFPPNSDNWCQCLTPVKTLRIYTVAVCGTRLF